MSKKTLIIIGVIVGAIFLLILALVGAGFWAWSAFKGQVRDVLNENAVIQQYVGEITELEIDLAASADEDTENVFVFLVKGSKSTGTVTAEMNTIDAESEQLKSGTLMLPSGEKHALFPADPGP